VYRFHRKLPFRALLAFVAAIQFARLACAGPFSELVVFGDSLSDVGNTSQVTPFFFKYPGPYYYNGRFSNGPVYTEALATGLGLPATVHSTGGGDNFAYGGAKTTGTGGLEGLFIDDIDEQVDDFLAARTADASALFLVYAGSNDLVGGQANVNIPVSNLADDVGRLIAAGARTFLVPNLPLLGYTPRYNDNPTTLAQFNSRTEQFNTALGAMLDGVGIANPLVTIHRLDVAALFNEALANPGAFGFVNVTDAAAPGLQPGASSYNTSQIAAQPNTYLFWDDLHPTAAVHAILAERALALFALAGDFNHDGVVDAADYVVWRRDDGGQAGYDLWRTNFGQTGGAGSLLASGSPVPELATLPSLVVALTAAACFRRRQSVAAGEIG